MAKTQTSKLEGSLLDAWAAPPDAGRPIAAIATTHQFDPHLWEFHLLPRFLGMDTDTLEEIDPFWIERETRLAEIYAAVLLDASSATAGATSPYWDQIGVAVPHGILHSKIALLQWQSCVRLIVGSANLTESGYRINHEIFYTLDFKNDPDSPPRSLLQAFLEALRKIGVYAPARHGAISRGPARERLLDALDSCRAQVSRWPHIRKAYSSRAETRLEPVIIEPGGKVGKDDLFSQLSSIWGQKADCLWVMSPFWDQPDGKKQAAQGLARLVRRQAQAWFVCSGEWLKPHTIASVAMPRTVVTTLEKMLGDCYVSPVIQNAEEDGAESRRALHAKALFLHDSHAYSHVYYAGSSNFTARGTGIIPANFEAGIALVRCNKNGNDLIPLFPGSSANYDLPARKVRFASQLERSEDAEPPEFIWPPFTLSAEYDARLKALTLRVASPRSELPPHCVAVYTGAEEVETLLDYSGGRPTPYPWSCSRTEFPRAVVLEWRGDDKTLHQILVPVQITDKKDLPPPEALRDLPLDDLIDYLSSMRPAWQYFRRHNKSHTDPGKPPVHDPLKLVNISGFLTTQVKRFGTAVAGLRRRLTEYPAVSRDGLRMRFYSPFGPWALLKAICRAGGFEMVTDADDHVSLEPNGSPDDQRAGMAAFLISELLLSLKWIPWKAMYQGSRSAEAKREWKKLISKVQTLSEQIAQMRTVDPRLSRYIRSVIQVDL